MGDSEQEADPLRRWCEWCGRPYRQAPTGRTARYCRRSCRQRAYEHRRELERTQAAVDASERALLAAGAPEPSRDDSRTTPRVAVQDTPQPGRPRRRTPEPSRDDSPTPAALFDSADVAAPAPGDPYVVGARVRLRVEQGGAYTSGGVRHESRVPAGTLGTIVGRRPDAGPVPYVVQWDTGTRLAMAGADLEPAPPGRARLTALDVWAQLPPLGG